MSDIERACAVRDDEDLLVYSEEDLEEILSDVYVDTREFVDEETAATMVEVVHDRLTDTYYSHSES